MFLPIGDSPNPEKFTPIVTWLLIGINLAVFAFLNIPLSAQPIDPTHPHLEEYIRMLLEQGLSYADIKGVLAHSSKSDLLLFVYGYKPGSPSIPDIFSSLFLHAGFMHLFGNMLFLYIYGDNVEHQMGRFRYLLTYLGTGVIATLSFALLAGDSMAPLVGASGAISGILGCYFFMFPKNKVKVFIFLFPIFISIVRIPARIVLAVYVVLDNLLPFIIQSSGNVAYGAHLGGFFGGLGVAAAGEYLGWRSLFLVRKKGKESVLNQKDTTLSSMAFQEGIRSATLSGDADALLHVIQSGKRRNFEELDIWEILEAAKLLKTRRFFEPANNILKAALALNKLSPYLSEVYFELGDTRYQQGFATAAYQHFLTALEMNPTKETEEKIHLMLRRLES